MSTTPIQPHVRFYNLPTGALISESSRVLDWTIDREANKPAVLTIEVPLTDPDSAPALVAAAGVNGTPTLMEFTLGGQGGATDAAKMIDLVDRKLKIDRPSVSDSGGDIASLLADVLILHSTYTDVKFSDALDGAHGTIVPLHPQHYGISSTNALPGVSGVLRVQPGNPTWVGLPKLTFTAYFDPAVGAISTNLDAYADPILKAIDALMKQMGGFVIAGDSVPQGERAIRVFDSSAPLAEDGTSLNLAQTLGLRQAGDGANSITFGHVGGTPKAGFGFNGDNIGLVLDESIEARVLDDAMEITDDISKVYDAVTIQGGSSNGGLPPNPTITSMAMLNGAPPSQSATRDKWTDNVCLIGITTDNERGGGLYYNFGDGESRAVPRSLAGPHLSIAVSADASTLYVGTPHGVYSHPSNLTDTTSAWVPVGGLDARVVRLQALPNGSGGTVLFAHVDGAKDKRTDGIYRFPGILSGVVGSDYGGWDFSYANDKILDMIATDEYTFFCLLKADQGNLYRYQATNATPVATRTAYPLPASIAATSIHRVITAGGTGHPAQDSIWLTTSGDNNGGWFLVEGATAGDWGTFQPGNADGSLVGPAGQGLQVNGYVGLGLTLAGVYTSIFASTNNGIWWSPTLDGKGWETLNGQNGLDGIGIARLAAGQQQQFLGTGTRGRTINRFFASNGNQFFLSNDSGAHWEDLARGKVTAGSYVSELVRTIQGHYPDNSLITAGPMLHSPLGEADATHLQIPATYLPANYYLERRLDQRGNWFYFLRNAAAAIPREYGQQVMVFATNLAANLLTQSTNVVRDMLTWLSRNSVPITTVKVPSAFSTREAGLRRLREGMVVPLTINRSVQQINAAGVVVTAPLVAYTNAPFRVRKHTMKGGDGLGYATTETELVTYLGDPLTPEQIATGMMDARHNLEVFGSR